MISPNPMTLTPFADVVHLNTDRIKDPLAEGIERYVGLEHITPEDLRVRRWGLVADGTTFTNYFKPGQVLFGKRRAYQRKVAVADFSGDCSSDIYVFESKDPNVLLPELLPFICQTEGFYEHAVNTSAGSLSPRTNWKQLAKYEFPLPPLDEQRRIVKLFQTSVRVNDLSTILLSKHEVLLQSFILNEFNQVNTLHKKRTVGELGEVVMGRQKAPKYRKGINPRPFLKVKNIGDLELHLETLEEMDFSEREISKYKLMPGDILLTEGDLVSQFNVGRPALYDGQIEDCCFQNTLIRFRSGPTLISQYALLLFEGARLTGVLAKTAKTTTVTHLGLGRFTTVKIPLPPLDRQQKIAEKFLEILNSRNSLRLHVEANKNIHKQLLYEVL